MHAEQIIFVRGTGRCGSKTLANQLGQHPAIAKVPANQCLPEELMDWSTYRLQPRCPFATEEAIVAACRAYFEAYCRHLTEEPGIILHKSTMNVHRLASLLEYWPDAKMVYIVRHPLGVVPAYISVDIVHYGDMYGYDATVANSLLRWYNDVAAYLRSPVFGHPRVLQVRFEDMIGDTDRFFERIYQFLGIDDGFRNALPGPVDYDHEFVLDQSERHWIITSTREILQQLGYEPDDWSPEVPAEIADRASLYADRRLVSRPPALDGVELVRLAAEEAAGKGFQRIGLFGAGYLSHLICPHLHEMPGEIVCLLDEDPLLVGRNVGGFEVRRPEQANELGVQAVIPATLVHQRALIGRWERIIGEAIPILPLWDEQGTEAVCV